MKRYFSFQWHITDECDQRCKHCYIFSENPNLKTQSVNFDGMKKILANCFKFCDTFERIPYFYITGGDPILNKDFWNLLNELKKHDIQFAILGNPFHLDAEICNRLRELGCDKYQMSIDGVQNTHDKLRKPGSFDCTLSKIDLLKQAGICSVIMTTVSSLNFKELPEIIDIVLTYSPRLKSGDSGINEPCTLASVLQILLRMVDAPTIFLFFIFLRRRISPQLDNDDFIRTD